jgi:hypothetical protein
MSAKCVEETLYAAGMRWTGLATGAGKNTAIEGQLVPGPDQQTSGKSSVSAKVAQIMACAYEFTMGKEQHWQT